MSFFFDSGVRVSAGTFRLANGMTGVPLGCGDAVSECGVRGQQILDADAVVELGPDAVGDGGDHLAAVPAGIDVGAVGPLARGPADDADDLVGDRRGLGVRWDQAGQARARVCAVSRPKPLDAPVTRTTAIR
ncbi:hypothetical protein GCM10010172_06130 [Paractinoplanes ferrugineus]|uniref:Uncharacterized protein n=1 Tax=Paractinoplanes ferrugineus TaxID=113564 RepID=A0A919J1W1_9ACTN|nr:hypothetical protein Afe05nite_43100 [Actinoplanes ferrugineus]